MKTVRVTVKYFGIISDLAGKREEVLETGEKTTLADLRARILNQYNTGRQTAAQIAVNGKGVSPSLYGDYVLKDGDVIMFLPPMSGG